jgi:hypothetical protein
MGVFSIDQKGQAALDELASYNPLDAAALRPSWYSGVPTAVGAGIMRGGVEAAQAVETYGRLAFDPRAAYHKDTTDEAFQSAINYWTPTPGTVGAAGEVLGGLAKVVLPLAATAGNPALLVGATNVSTVREAKQRGVDEQTAGNLGAASALSAAIGLKLPFLGSTLASRLTSGAIGNLVLGAADTAAQRALLEGSGYHELAAQYHPLDVQSRAVDLLTGLAFGAVAHVAMRPSDRAAVASAANAKHFQVDTAPGMPANLAASVSHQDAMHAVTEQLLRGEPAVAPEPHQGALFEPRPDQGPRPIPSELTAVDEALPAERAPGAISPAEIPRAANLTPEQRSVETAIAEKIARDPAAAEAEYAKLEDAQGGKLLSADTARELSDHYLKKRSLSEAVHEPVSWLIKRMYARMLGEAPGPGQDPLVLFTGGGTGAGKTSAVRNALQEISKRAQIIYDTNLGDLSSAIRKVNQALDAGKRVHIVYVYREPVDALVEGALARAMRQEKKHGSGRTVPMEAHAETHASSNATIRKLAEHYANDPRVEIGAIDNSHGKDNARPILLSDLATVDYNSIRERGYKALEQEYAAGRISEPVYRGFAGSKSDASAAEAPGVASGAGGQPKPQRQEQRPNAVAAPSAERSGALFAVDSARKAAESLDLRMPTGEFNADGSPVAMTAREILARDDAEIAKATNDAKAYDAVAGCFLSAGA